MLPAAAPNLLANGAQGIAVGMATSVPPHNVAELLDAALYLIAHPGSDDRSAAAISRRARISRPAASSSTIAPSIAETYRTGRGVVPPARALGRRRTPGAAAGSRSSPKFPTACRSRG